MYACGFFLHKMLLNTAIYCISPPYALVATYQKTCCMLKCSYLKKNIFKVNLVNISP